MSQFFADIIDSLQRAIKRDYPCSQRMHSKNEICRVFCFNKKKLFQDCNSEVHFILPANVDGNSDRDLSSSDQKKHKKKKAGSSQESHNGNSVSSLMKVEPSSDETSLKKKHVKRRKSICAQDILAQIESDPSLLDEIQSLLKARVTKQMAT